jgi:hypothetical protein
MSGQDTADGQVDPVDVIQVIASCSPFRRG